MVPADLPADTIEAPDRAVPEPGKDDPPRIGGRDGRYLKPAKRFKKPSIRQQAFIKALADPSSPTYGKKGPSALAAGYASPAEAFKILAREPVQAELERHLAEARATTQDRIGVIASVLHKCKSVTESYGKDGTLLQRTVTDNDKMRLAAAKELSRLDGSYQRAATMGHAQRRVLDAGIAEWTKRLRASLRPDSPPTEVVEGEALGAAVGPTGDAGVLEGETVPGGVADAPTGTGSALAGEGGRADGGEGGRGGYA